MQLRQVLHRVADVPLLFVVAFQQQIVYVRVVRRLAFVELEHAWNGSHVRRRIELEDVLREVSVGVPRQRGNRCAIK